MNQFYRFLFILTLLACAVVMSGCQNFWHNVQPHRLHHMNRGNGMRPPSEVYSQNIDTSKIIEMRQLV